MTIRNPHLLAILFVESLEMVSQLPRKNCRKLFLMTLLFYIGLLVVEGDVHKHQVRILFQDLCVYYFQYCK